MEYSTLPELQLAASSDRKAIKKRLFLHSVAITLLLPKLAVKSIPEQLEIHLDAARGREREREPWRGVACVRCKRALEWSSSVRGVAVWRMENRVRVVTPVTKRSTSLYPSHGVWCCDAAAVCADKQVRELWGGD